MFSHVRQVHGNMHGLLGGAFDCNINFGAFQDEHPEYSTGLLTFLLEYMTTNYWPDNSFMPDYNRCDTSCDKDSPERCGCTCLIDADSIAETEVSSSGSPSKRRGRLCLRARPLALASWCLGVPEGGSVRCAILDEENRRLMWDLSCQ